MKGTHSFFGWKEREGLFVLSKLSGYSPSSFGGDWLRHREVSYLAMKVQLHSLSTPINSRSLTDSWLSHGLSVKPLEGGLCTAEQILCLFPVWLPRSPLGKGWLGSVQNPTLFLHWHQRFPVDNLHWAPVPFPALRCVFKPFLFFCSSHFCFLNLHR